MKDQAMLQKFLLDGTWREAVDFDQVYKPLQPSCYEVIRMIDGKPLFLHAHYERFLGTVSSVDQPVPFTEEELREKLCALADENGVKNYNAKLIYNDFDNGGHVYLFLTHTSYPSDEMYRDGVKTDFLQVERENPHAKIINASLRDQADALMKAEGLFEAVLLDRDGNVTEGSKSNIFFIKDGCLCTSPADGVLLGVTRTQIIDIAQRAGIRTLEVKIPRTEIGSYSAAFISGTSPKILPIAEMGEFTFDVNDVTLRKMMALYDEDIQNDISCCL